MYLGETVPVSPVSILSIANGDMVKVYNLMTSYHTVRVEKYIPEKVSVWNFPIR